MVVGRDCVWGFWHGVEMPSFGVPPKKDITNDAYTYHVIIHVIGHQRLQLIGF